MLTQVDVKNVQGGTLQIPMAQGAGYYFEDIEGIGLVKATLTSTSNAQADGAVLQSSRRDVRNITAKIKFNPNYQVNSVQSLRMALYQYLQPKMNIVLTFWLDGAIFAEIPATVESFDDTRFSLEPGMDLSVICYDPDFSAPADVTENGSTVTSTANQIMAYGGTSDAGVIFTLNITAATTGFTIYNTRPDNTLQVFDVENLSLAAGDTVTVTSIPGKKSVTRTRLGVVTSLLYGVDPSSVWPTLQSGDNLFRCHASTAGMTYTVKYTPKYAGL